MYSALCAFGLTGHGFVLHAPRRVFCGVADRTGLQTVSKGRPDWKKTSALKQNDPIPYKQNQNIYLKLSQTTAKMLRYSNTSMQKVARAANLTEWCPRAPPT